MLLLSSTDLKKVNFFNILSGTLSECQTFGSISGPISVGPDLGPNCLQMFSADNKSCHKQLFSSSTQLSTKFILLSTKFILLINVKMPTIVGILTFISMINTTSRRLKARNFFICRYFSFYEQLKFWAQLS